MGAPPEEGTGRAGGPFRRPPPCPLAGHGLRDAPEVAALQVLAPAGLEAGVHEEEGGAGALSEGAGGWGGRPHAYRLPRMVACIRPGWCDFSQEGPLGPEGMAHSDGWTFKCPSQTVILHLGREGAEDWVSHGHVAWLNLLESAKNCCFPFCRSNRESRGQGQRAGPGIPETHTQQCLLCSPDPTAEATSPH